MHPTFFQEAALAELEAAEAERNRLLRRLKSQERRLSAAQVSAEKPVCGICSVISFPHCASIIIMTFRKL